MSLAQFFFAMQDPDSGAGLRFPSCTANPPPNRKGTLDIFPKDAGYHQQIVRDVYRLVGRIYSQTGSVTLANSVTETTLLSGSFVGSKTLQANGLMIGHGLRVRAWGRFSTLDPTPGTLRIKLKLGAVTIGDTGAQLLTPGVVDRLWRFDSLAVVRTEGATGTIFPWSVWEHLIPAGQGNPTWWELPNLAAVTIDTTVDNALDLTAQFSVANASNKIICDNVLVEVA